LARRFIHIFGPSRHESFTDWAGISPGQGAATFAELAAADELVEVTTPIGVGVILVKDEASFRGSARQPAVARLLPSGDTFYLAWGANRELLVTDPSHRAQLWTSRVWPGALLVNGEINGTWRRDQHKVTVSSWRRHSPAERATIEAEALALPLPGLTKPLAVTWDGWSAASSFAVPG
jgi:hypothetical protein